MTSDCRIKFVVIKYDRFVDYNVAVDDGTDAVVEKTPTLKMSSNLICRVAVAVAVATTI